MKSSKSIQIRAPGQRSIPSTFLFRSSHKFSISNKEGSNVGAERGKNGSNVPLTSFLNRKLLTGSVLPIDKVTEGRSLPMKLDPDGPKESDNSVEQDRFQGTRQGPTHKIEDSVLKLFNSSEGNIRKRSSDCMAASSRLEGGVKDSQNHVVVLGDDPKPKRRVYRQVRDSSENKKPLYNHYENGTGWWDSEREGIDNDEVGSKETWEGVGSTTLGGLDWN